MHVTDMTTDFWEGASSQSITVQSPLWEVIEGAIRNLDGLHRTLVTLGAGGEAHLAVGGGSDGRYVVYITFDNLQFFTLASDNQSNEKVMLYIGGQEGDYERSIVVDLTSALRATKTFFEAGQVDPDLRWQTD